MGKSHEASPGRKIHHPNCRILKEKKSWAKEFKRPQLPGALIFHLSNFRSPLFLLHQVFEDFPRIEGSFYLDIFSFKYTTWVLFSASKVAHTRGAFTSHLGIILLTNINCKQLMLHKEPPPKKTASQEVRMEQTAIWNSGNSFSGKLYPRLQNCKGICMTGLFKKFFEKLLRNTCLSSRYKNNWMH